MSPTVVTRTGLASLAGGAGAGARRGRRARRGPRRRRLTRRLRGRLAGGSGDLHDRHRGHDGERGDGDAGHHAATPDGASPLFRAPGAPRILTGLHRGHPRPRPTPAAPRRRRPRRPRPRRVRPGRSSSQAGGRGGEALGELLVAAQQAGEQAGVQAHAGCRPGTGPPGRRRVWERPTTLRPRGRDLEGGEAAVAGVGRRAGARPVLARALDPHHLDVGDPQGAERLGDRLAQPAVGVHHVVAGQRVAARAARRRGPAGPRPTARPPARRAARPPRRPRRGPPRRPPRGRPPGGRAPAPARSRWTRSSAGVGSAPRPSSSSTGRATARAGGERLRAQPPPGLAQVARRGRGPRRRPAGRRPSPSR